MLISISDDFDLKKIEESGQCFRIREFPDQTFRFVSGRHILYIRKKDTGLFEADCSEAEWNSFWHSYFDLDRNYAGLRSRIPASDSFLFRAAEEGTGIRILRQEPFETVISFIISQRKNIPAIKKAVERICEEFGEKISAERETLFLFPSLSELSRADEALLAPCRLGYRTPYVLDAVRYFSLHDPDSLSSLSDEELFSALLEINGVGIKVASCSALFAFGRTSFAPVDTWIKKVIDRKYAGKDPFPAYGKDAGIIQQYLFYSARLHPDEF